jgi:hypothetical protein
VQEAVLGSGHAPIGGYGVGTSQLGEAQALLEEDGADQEGEVGLLGWCQKGSAPSSSWWVCVSLGKTVDKLRRTTFNDVLEELIQTTNLSYRNSFLYEKDEQLFRQLGI